MQCRTTQLRLALAMIASFSSACVTLEDDPDEAEQASELTTALGDADLYKCVSPMCGGHGLRFDSRDLLLDACAYDARAGVLGCAADPAASPAIPRAFWDANAMQLTCAAGLRFTCAGTTGVVSCVCASSSTAGVTYGPVITIKPKG